MKQPNNWNTPLKSVLKDLQSDKRRVENAALRELRRRFVGLDKKEQMMVLMHHLRREKSYREWAYSRLLDMWDNSFEPVIAELWGRYHEEQCAWPIVRHFPLSYIQKHKEELSIGRNRPFVIRRLCEEKSYVIDQGALDSYEYLWVISSTGREISAHEGWKLLVRVTKDICETKNAIDYADGETFSEKINKILYHLDKMGMNFVADKYRNWYQSSLNGITDRQLWDWYRISKQLHLEGINHPYDFLVEKLAHNLEGLELIKVL
jgi:hypothetical protein